LTGFSERRGPGIVRILEMTGCRTYSEFVSMTNPPERRLIIKSIEAHDRQKRRRRQASSPSPTGF